jgi:hypothetical protein
MRTGGIALTSSTASGGRRRFLHFARNIFKGVLLSTVMGGFRLSRPEIEAIIPDTIRDFGKFASQPRASHEDAKSRGANSIAPDLVWSCRYTMTIAARRV